MLHATTEFDATAWIEEAARAVAGLDAAVARRYELSRSHYDYAAQRLAEIFPGRPEAFQAAWLHGVPLQAADLLPDHVFAHEARAILLDWAALRQLAPAPDLREARTTLANPLLQLSSEIAIALLITEQTHHLDSDSALTNWLTNAESGGRGVLPPTPSHRPIQPDWAGTSDHLRLIQFVLIPLAEHTGLWGERNRLDSCLELIREPAGMLRTAELTRSRAPQLAGLADELAGSIRDVGVRARFDFHHLASIHRNRGPNTPDRFGWVTITVSDALHAFLMLGELHERYGYAGVGFQDFSKGRPNTGYRAVHTLLTGPRSAEGPVAVRLIWEEPAKGLLCAGALDQFSARRFDTPGFVRIWTPERAVHQLRTEDAIVLVYAGRVHSELVPYTTGARVTRRGNALDLGPTARLEQDDVVAITHNRPEPAERVELRALGLSESARKRLEAAYSKHDSDRALSRGSVELQRLVAGRPAGVTVRTYSEVLGQIAMLVRTKGPVAKPHRDRRLLIEIGRYHLGLESTVTEEHWDFVCQLVDGIAVSPSEIHGARQGPCSRCFPGGVPSSVLVRSEPVWAERGARTGTLILHRLDTATALPACGERPGQPMPADYVLIPGAFVLQTTVRTGLILDVSQVFRSLAVEIRRFVATCMSTTTGVFRIDVDPVLWRDVQAVRTLLLAVIGVVQVWVPGEDPPHQLGQALPRRPVSSDTDGPLPAPWRRNSAVTEMDMFYGREGELADLVRRAKAVARPDAVAGAYIALAGPYKSGKTSLSHAAARQCELSLGRPVLFAKSYCEERNWTQIAVDLAGFLVKRAMDRGHPHWTGILRAEKKNRSQSFWTQPEALEATIRTLLGLPNPPVVVIFLDELVGWCMEQELRGNDGDLARLREFLTMPHRVPGLMILSGVAAEPCWRLSSVSRMAVRDQAELVKLGPFRQDELADFVAGSRSSPVPIEATVEALRELELDTGGEPFLASAVCCTWWKMECPTIGTKTITLTPDKYAAARRKLLDDTIQGRGDSEIPWRFSRLPSEVRARVDLAVKQAGQPDSSEDLRIRLDRADGATAIAAGLVRRVGGDEYAFIARLTADFFLHKPDTASWPCT
ncbi:MAG: ATP-binding protein [Myxococcales bacterium]|nr:ATP-binding protein [Myxococcales bacterium]